MPDVVSLNGLGRGAPLATALAAWQRRFAVPRREAFDHAFGDTAVAARFVGLSRPPGPIKGEWQHGVVVAERNRNPDWIIGGDGLSHSRRSKRYFVARADQVHALAGFGFSDVHAIGLPFAYVTPPRVVRVAASLLAMPSHGLPEIGSRVVHTYADYIAAQRRHFDEVAVCLHSVDFADDSVRLPFERQGITVVRGADPDDAHAYDRMAELFSMFDVVTSNEFGSHVAYAGACGAKVAIDGPSQAFDRRMYLKLPYYRNNAAVLDLMEEFVTSRTLERAYPFLFAEPREAQPCRAWAAEQIGEDNRRTPGELRSLFGWTPGRIVARRVRKTIDGAVGRVRRMIWRLQARIAHG